MGASTHQSPRQRRSDELAYVARCLTDRDRQIVEAVARFGVFTAEHIAEMFFDSLKRAQVRLQRLHAVRVLDRFQPYRVGWGSSPFHYILGASGAPFIEAAGGGCGRRVRRPGHRLALGCRRELDRVVLVNGLYASLLGNARRRAGELEDWLTADEVSVWSDGIVQADAFATWRENDHATEFFLEVDRGGSWTSRLQSALARHQRFAAERGAWAWLLVLAATERRETAIREAIDCRAAPVATSNLTQCLNRFEGWLPVGSDVRRKLSHLPPPPTVGASRRGWRFETRPGYHSP